MQGKVRSAKCGVWGGNGGVFHVWIVKFRMCSVACVCVCVRRLWSLELKVECTGCAV